MEISFLKQLILVLNLKLFLMKCPSVVSTHNKSGSKVVYTTGQFTRQAVSKGTDEFYLENLDNYYVCLTPGKDPQLISLTQVLKI